MSELSAIREWFAYGSVARTAYLEVFGTIDPAELSRDRGASYPTILEIFRHSLDGTSFWVEKVSAYLGPASPAFRGAEESTLENVRRYSRETEKQVERFLTSLTEGDLGKYLIVPPEPGFWNETFRVRVRDVLYQTIGHELQHRGELNALLWQMNIEPPITDWPDFNLAQTRRAMDGSSGVLLDRSRS